MNTKEPIQQPRFEHRWPAVFAVLVLYGLLAFLPARVRLFPAWCLYASALALLLPMFLVELRVAREWWIRVQRPITLVFAGVLMAGTLTTVRYLIVNMVRGSVELSGLQLLTSSVGAWAVNVFVFTLIYWELDRGGPEGRLSSVSTKPDWLFPQETAPPEAVRTDWRPAFIDYLYLGFATATAFSTTDAMPLTSRAKALMMLEGTISLVTILVVAARAINILA